MPNATPSATCSISEYISFLSSGSNVLIVPIISASSGMILFLVPALTIPTEITAGLFIIFIRLLTIVFRDCISSAVAITGSIPAHGVEP